MILNIHILYWKSEILGLLLPMTLERQVTIFFFFWPKFTKLRRKQEDWFR